MPSGSPTPGRQSPQKAVTISRGNNRVSTSVVMSPSQLRRRSNNPKLAGALKQSRKPSNPLEISPTKRLPKPVTGKVSEEDEWQDIEPASAHAATAATTVSTSNAASNTPKTKAKPPTPFKWPELKPPPQPESHSSMVSDLSHTQDHTTKDSTTTQEDDTTHSSTSFFRFSPSHASSRFMKSLGQQSKRFRPSSWNPRYNEEPVTPERQTPRRYLGYSDQMSSQVSVPPPPFQPDQPSATNSILSSVKAFWLDPSTPGLLALYLQVGFNMVMLGSLLYAILIFYQTIRNDVNLKVEEYSMDIVDEIAKCTHEYIRNGCDPSKRVPGMEAACQQWDRCMQRNPQEIGRAKVSAETFGMIIEAFLKPIGIRSMVFLVAVFAGSFLLVNGVFSSRIGPRFAYRPAEYNTPSQPQGKLQHQPQPPPSAQHIAFQQPMHHSLSYASSIYSPSHIATPRGRHSPIHATLQSSPLRQPPYMGGGYMY